MWKPLLGAGRKKTTDSEKMRDELDLIHETEEEVDFLVAYQRKRCSALMFFGALLGFFGFTFAFLIGLWKFLSPGLSEFHTAFPSGNGYFPATVSEMVHNPEDPAGKCFFAFEFIGAMFIFMSWYPWELRTCYTGDSELVPIIGCLGGMEISWPMFRQFVPTVGMMLVATVTTTPFAQATPLDYICISIHLTGAVMLFAGYVFVEAYTLYFSENMKKIIPPNEKRWRAAILFGIGFFYMLFSVITGVTLLPLNASMEDKWQKMNYTDPYPPFGNATKVVLVDTASGWVLGLKLLSYFSEVMCGLLLIGSFMCIWYFCHERKQDLKDELRDINPELGSRCASSGSRNQ